MIDTERTFGTTTIYCDQPGCNNDQEFEGFDGEPDFMGAIRDAKVGGWGIIRKGNDWQHLCPVHNPYNKDND